MLEGFDEFVNESLTLLYHNLVGDFWFCFIAILIAGVICIYHNHMRDIREYVIGDFKVFLLITTMFSFALLGCTAYIGFGKYDYLIYALFALNILGFFLMIIFNNLRYLYLIVLELVINLGLMCHHFIPNIAGGLNEINEFAVSQRHTIYAASNLNADIVLIFSLITIALISYIVYYVNYYSTSYNNEEIEGLEPLKHELYFCERFNTHTIFERIFSSVFASLLAFVLIIGPQFLANYYNPHYRDGVAIYNRYTDSILVYRENQECLKDEAWLNEYNDAKDDLVEYCYRPYTYNTNIVGAANLSSYSYLCESRLRRLQAIELVEDAMSNHSLDDFNRAANYHDYVTDLGLVVGAHGFDNEVYSACYKLLLGAASSFSVITIFLPLKLIGVIAIGVGAIVLAMVISKKRYYRLNHINVIHDYHQLDFTKAQKTLLSVVVVIATLVIMFFDAVGVQTSEDPYIRHVNDTFVRNSGKLVETLVYNKYDIESEYIVSLCDEQIARYQDFINESKPLDKYQEANTVLVANSMTLIDILEDIKEDVLDGEIKPLDIDNYTKAYGTNLHVVVDINIGQLDSILDDLVDDSVDDYFDSDDD